MSDFGTGNFGLLSGAIQAIQANRQQQEEQARAAAQKIAEQFSEQMQQQSAANDKQRVTNETNKVNADITDKSDETKQAQKDTMDLYGSGLFGKPLGDFAEQRGLDRKAYENLPESPQVVQQRTDTQNKLKSAQGSADERRQALLEKDENRAYLLWIQAGGVPEAFATVWAHRPSVYGLHPDQAGQGQSSQAQPGQTQQPQQAQPGGSPLLPASPTPDAFANPLGGGGQTTAPQTPLLPGQTPTVPGEILPGVQMPPGWQGKIDAQKAQTQSRLAYAKKMNLDLKLANQLYDVKVQKALLEIKNLNLRNTETKQRTEKIIKDIAKETLMTPLQVQALRTNIAATQQNMLHRQQQSQIEYQNFLDKQSNDPRQKRQAATGQAATLNRQIVQMNQRAAELVNILSNPPASGGQAVNGVDPAADWEQKAPARQVELSQLQQQIADMNTLYGATMQTYQHYNKQVNAPKGTGVAPAFPRLPGGGLPNNGIGSVGPQGTQPRGGGKNYQKMTNQQLLQELMKKVK